MVHLFGYGQTGIEVISQTIQSTKALKSLYFEMISRERIDDEYKISVAIVKCNLSPYQTYLQSVLDDGGRGPEVLYRANKNNTY